MAEISTNTEQCKCISHLIARQFSLNPTGVEIHKQRDLCRVKRRNGKYGGYRKDILSEILTDRDEVFLICDICKGIMRQPCFTNSGEQFCSCCEVDKYQSVYTGNPCHSKHTPNEVVRKMVNSLKCSCPLLERSCKWLGTLKDCEEHLDTCGYVRDQCKLGCGTVLQRNKLRAHEAEKCPCRKVECERCNQYFTFHDLTTYHKKCPKMELTCELKCGVVMCREDMAQHLKKECGMVVEMCELGCGVKMTRNELKIHLTDTCVQRMIPCEHCKEDIKFCDMLTHLDVCPRMEVSCELTCGVIMCREELNNHLEEFCPEKELACPFVKYNCEVTSIIRKHLSQHLEEKRIEHLELKINAMEEEARTYREESKQHIEQDMEEVNQQRKHMDNKIIRISRMTEQINTLSSISNTIKLDWNIENLSKFIQINHIPEQRNVSGRDISIHFLKEHIYVSFRDIYGCYFTFSAKYLIRLYSTIRCKVVKQYDCGRIDLTDMLYSCRTKRIARISESDAEELSRTGSANKLILEMYITKL